MPRGVLLMAQMLNKQSAHLLQHDFLPVPCFRQTKLQKAALNCSCFVELLFLQLSSLLLLLFALFL